MRQSVIELSKYEKMFLKAILDDANKSDAKVAKETGMSKATANRIRKELEKKKIILKYLPIVDLDKLGIKVFMIILFHWKGYKDVKETEKMLNDLEKDQHVAFLATGEGSGFTHIIFLGFTDLSQGHYYVKKFRMKYDDEIENLVSFFIPSVEIAKQDYTDTIKSVIIE